MSEEESAYLAIGRAICASQIFEVVMAVCVRFFHIVTASADDPPPNLFFDRDSLKNPTKNLVMRLSQRNEISAEFESRIVALIEARHLLIHRWFVENGFSSSADVEGWFAYKALAAQVESESNGIALLLAGYMVKWAEPEWAKKNPSEYLARMHQMFHAPGGLPGQK